MNAAIITPTPCLEEKGVRPLQVRGGADPVEVIDPLDGPQWDRLVAEHEQAEIFHTARWASVLHKSYDHQPVYLRWRDARGGSGSLLPLMEVRSLITGRRGVSLPFTDFCDPLTSGPTEFERLVPALIATARARNWRLFEVRCAHAAAAPASASAAPKSTSDTFTPTADPDFYGHVIDLRGARERVFAGINSAGQRAIRKAERSGLRVDVAQTPESLATYYQLHCRTRRRHGLPPQPAAFFRHILHELIEPGSGFVVTARDRGAPLAAAIFLTHKNRAIYKFGGSIIEAQDLRPNNLVMWEAIKFLAGQGCSTLHLGRTSISNTGLRRYKLSWGSREHPILYFRYDVANATWTRGADRAAGFHNRIFARLPLRLNQIIGSAVYPHLD